MPSSFHGSRHRWFGDERLGHLSWRRRWQRARHIWRFCAIIWIANGRRLWWVGVLAATGLISLWLLAIGQMAIGAQGVEPTMRDWLLVPFLLLPIMAMLSLMIHERLRKALGYPERRQPIRGRWWLRPGLGYIDSKAGGMALFLNVVGCLAAPFALFWLAGRILEMAKAPWP